MTGYDMNMSILMYTFHFKSASLSLSACLAMRPWLRAGVYPMMICMNVSCARAAFAVRAESEILAMVRRRGIKSEKENLRQKKHPTALKMVTHDDERTTHTQRGPPRAFVEFTGK